MPKIWVFERTSSLEVELDFLCLHLPILLCQKCQKRVFERTLLLEVKSDFLCLDLFGLPSPVLDSRLWVILERGWDVIPVLHLSDPLGLRSLNWVWSSLQYFNSLVTTSVFLCPGLKFWLWLSYPGLSNWVFVRFTTEWRAHIRQFRHQMSTQTQMVITLEFSPLLTFELLT